MSGKLKNKNSRKEYKALVNGAILGSKYIKNVTVEIDTDEPEEIKILEKALTTLFGPSAANKIMGSVCDPCPDVEIIDCDDKYNRSSDKKSILKKQNNGIILDAKKKPNKTHKDKPNIERSLCTTSEDDSESDTEESKVKKAKKKTTKKKSRKDN